jgi:hypothetical protein
MTHPFRSIAVISLAITALSPSASHGGLYWQHGVRSKTVTVCFVGDAPSLRPDRVNQIRQYIREHEFAANVRFQYLGSCPAATQQSNGNDYFDGDIRVVIPGINVSGTGPVPGNGCQMFIENGVYNKKNDGWGSWSNAPDDLAVNRSCQYNLKLGDDPWNDTPYLNHTLHEFGHALGLAHEHQRNDANIPACIEKYPQFTDQTACKKANHVWIGYCMNGYGVGTSEGYLTLYDRNSVMHYAFPSCGIEGNYGYSGLSSMDQLSVHILYPENVQVAEFIGTTVIPSTRPLALASAWQARGANLAFAAQDFSWRLSGTLLGTNASVSFPVAPGNYRLEFAHKDFLDRTYSYAGPVRVLTPQDYNRFAAGIVAAQSVMFH